MAHMLVFHSCLNMIMQASIQCTLTYTVKCARTHSETWACTHGPAETQREKLNHIISAQIINDIIFGCSLYNVGQLDAGGNEEGVRLREGGEWERGTKEIAEKQSVWSMERSAGQHRERWRKESKMLRETASVFGAQKRDAVVSCWPTLFVEVVNDSSVHDTNSWSTNLTCVRFIKLSK